MILKNEAGKLSALSQDTGTPWMANTKTSTNTHDGNSSNEVS